MRRTLDLNMGRSPLSRFAVFEAYGFTKATYEQRVQIFGAFSFSILVSRESTAHGWGSLSSERTL